MSSESSVALPLGMIANPPQPSSKGDFLPSPFRAESSGIELGRFDR